MSKKRVVVETSTGCKILTNPAKEDYSHLPHVVNPDLSTFVGTSPEDWLISAGGVYMKPGVKRPIMLTGDVSEEHAAIIRASSREVRCAVLLSITSIIFALASIVLKFI